MPCGAEPDEGVDAEHPPGMTKLQRSVSRAAGIRPTFNIGPRRPNRGNVWHNW